MKKIQECSIEKTERPYQEGAVGKGLCNTNCGIATCSFRHVLLMDVVIYFKRNIFILATLVYCSGACLHHLQLEEGHAKRVRKGEETEGAHQGFGCLVS